MDTIEITPFSSDQQMTLSAPEDSPSTLAPNQKPRSNINRIAGLVILGSLVFCALLTVGVVALIGTLKAYAREQGNVELVLDSFMRSVENKDTAQAYTFVSKRATAVWTRSMMDGMTKGNNYALFDGYSSIKVTYCNIGFQSSNDPDEPQGTVAQVSGIVTYDGDWRGTFDAVLEKEGDVWRINAIQVSVPPDKISQDANTANNALSH